MPPRLDWDTIVRLRDGEGLSFGEIGRRMAKSKGSIQNAYETAKARGWTAEGPPEEITEEKTKRAIPSAIPRIAHLETEEIQELKEVMTWWRDRKRNTAAIPERNTHRSRRTYWIEDALHEAVKDRAEREDVSMADLVNRALRRYLEGHTGGINER